MSKLEELRHSCAHLLAAAVLQLWPNAKNAIGPAIEDGFYQDFDLGNVKISENDLKKIEEKMREIVKTWGPFKTKEVTINQAKKDFAHNPYKVELAEEFAKEGKTITENNPGNFLDLCKGGHAENPAKELIHFKLLKIAGAYWRGNEKNKMLTRIYGAAFPTKEELDNYLHMLEEAKKRDHKILGKELDLFTFSELVGPGLPLWTPKGTLLRILLDDFVWELRKQRGYQKVAIPHITKKELYETSGHWQKFKEDLFKIKTREGHEFAMKPMNCPHHTQIYKHVLRSYRDLPQRYAETTMVYRDEQTGELSGLSRVRCITQDDAHVFCREIQVKEEVFKIWDIIEIFYKSCGFKDFKVRLSISDPKTPEKYLGTKEIWRKAEKQLREFVKERKAEVFEAIGEAAFYGPKLDFMSKDTIGRELQIATIQIDRNMPERFDLTCENEKNEKERIVMIHAAIMGSLERFISVLIEHHAGKFPVWLSPVQAVLMTVADRHVSYTRDLQKELVEKGIKVEVDDRQESIPKKVRDNQTQRTPYIITIGDKEIETGNLAIRTRDNKVITLKKQEFVEKILREINNKDAS